jgi:hypothetical protein
VDVPVVDLPTIEMVVDLNFYGQVTKPEFKQRPPLDDRVSVDSDGELNFNRFDGWVKITFVIGKTGNLGIVNFPPSEVGSFLYSDDEKNSKKAWDRRSEQFSDVKIISPTSLKICYTNNKRDGSSVYSLMYDIGGVRYYHDPRIKNGVSALMKNPPCKF